MRGRSRGRGEAASADGGADAAQPNHYKALGVGPEATGAEIRAAYRRIARASHPDKADGEQARFVEAAAAYEVLSDERRRHAYDVAIMGVQEGLGSGSRGEAAIVTLSIPVGDVYTDTRRTVRYDCRGPGGETRARVEELFVPAGTRDFERVRFPGLGDAGASGEAGDLTVVVRHRARRGVRVDGIDVQCGATVSLRQALCGAPFAVTRPDGRVLRVRAPAGTALAPGAWLRLDGHGLPDRHAGRSGDLLVRVEVAVPPTLPEEAVAALARALPPDPAPPEGCDVTGMPAAGPLAPEAHRCPVQ